MNFNSVLRKLGLSIALLVLAGCPERNITNIQPIKYQNSKTGKFEDYNLYELSIDVKGEDILLWQIGAYGELDKQKRDLENQMKANPSRAASIAFQLQQLNQKYVELTNFAIDLMGEFTNHPDLSSCRGSSNLMKCSSFNLAAATMKTPIKINFVQKPDDELFSKQTFTFQGELGLTDIFTKEGFNKMRYGKPSGCLKAANW